MSSHNAYQVTPEIKTYKLTWEIEVDAENPQEAALLAESMMLEQCEASHTGPYFFVYNMTDKKEEEDVDLEQYYTDNADEIA